MVHIGPKLRVREQRLAKFHLVFRCRLMHRYGVNNSGISGVAARASMHESEDKGASASNRLTRSALLDAATHALQLETCDED